MNLIHLHNYRVRREDSYYWRGYYLADIISMHRSIASLSNASDRIELEPVKHIACVASYAGIDVKDHDVICYNPYVLLHGTSADELLHIVAHEVMHVKNNDGFRIKLMDNLLLVLGIVLFLTTIYLCFPLVVGIPVFIHLLRMAGLREIETQADFGTLEYVSLSTVLRFTAAREPTTKYGWLFYDHATRKSLLRKVEKKYDKLCGGMNDKN